MADEINCISHKLKTSEISGSQIKSLLKCDAVTGEVVPVILKALQS
jgi:hypothetical protein